tara:strand:- start:131 stop:451 length:321 start_codon:yes stop_codon:yes gene_type:complete
MPKESCDTSTLCYYKKKYGISKFNVAKRTPSHPTKSHLVVVRTEKNGKMVIKVIRFGQQGVRGEGKPNKSDSEKEKSRRSSFKARHAENIKKGKLSAAYWANKVKW